MCLCSVPIHFNDVCTRVIPGDLCPTVMDRRESVMCNFCPRFPNDLGWPWHMHGSTHKRNWLLVTSNIVPVTFNPLCLVPSVVKNLTTDMLKMVPGYIGMFCIPFQSTMTDTLGHVSPIPSKEASTSKVPEDLYPMRLRPDSWVSGLAMLLSLTHFSGSRTAQGKGDRSPRKSFKASIQFFCLHASCLVSFKLVLHNFPSIGVNYMPGSQEKKTHHFSERTKLIIFWRQGKAGLVQNVAHHVACWLMPWRSGRIIPCGMCAASGCLMLNWSDPKWELVCPHFLSGLNPHLGFSCLGYLIGGIVLTELGRHS